MLTDILFPTELQLRVDRIEMEKDTVNMSITSTNGQSIFLTFGHEFGQNNLLGV